MLEPNVVDILYFLLFLVLVPTLTAMYIPLPLFSQKQRLWVMLGGLTWMGYVYVSEYVSTYYLGVPWLDANYHLHWARELLQQLQVGNWRFFVSYFKPGNSAYHCYSALVLYTGGSVFSLVAINAFIAFWGGLILATCVASIVPFPRRKLLLLLFIVFCPSVIFWCTVNLKEAMMFWSICNVFSIGFPVKGGSYVARSILAGLGLAVGSLLRPHVMVGWLAAALAILVLRRGKKFAAVILLMILPVVGYGLKNLMKADFTQDTALALGETQLKNLSVIAHQGSRIQYTGGKPIFFISGFLSAFFRPFPWEIRSASTLAGSMETWSMTILIIYGWMSVGSARRTILKLPCVQIAVLACIWMCILLSYFPNEGLMLRQRVQMIPALLVLVALPILVKNYVAERNRAVRRQAASASAPAYAR